MAPPCFLVLVTDQLRADHLGCYGHPVARTPAIDALAAASRTFDRAYVANPVCMPNRATIATGRWPSAHGTRTNGIALDQGSATFMRSLRAAGWETVAVGKLHFQTMGAAFGDGQLAEMGRNAPLLVDPAACDAVDRGDGWDRWEDRDRHAAADVRLPADYYGFEHVNLAIGHGDRIGGNYLTWARERGLDPREVSGWARARERYEGWQQVFRTEVPTELHCSSYIVERTIGHLERLAQGERPFLVFCSFPDPHHPFAPPGDYWGMFDPADMPLPRTFGDRHEGSAPHIRQLAARIGQPAADRTLTWAPDEEQLRWAMAAELGLIAMVDDGVGRILDALARLGLDERTTVLFTSDHGDLFGDHGLLLKHFVHYDGVMRVPLTVRVPGGDAGRSDALVSSADIAPTLLDLAGVRPYRGIQGRSLRPLLEGAAERLRTRLLVEEDQSFGVPGLPAPVRMRTLVTDTERLTLYAGREIGELYNRADDPDELRNLYAEPDAAPLRERLVRGLADEMMRTCDEGLTPLVAA